MYTLKSIARRSTLLGAAGALLVASFAPAASVMAAELNPLTERSLLLSSSAPGWQDTDGSGFSETNRNPAGQYYAEPGSGPNGKKTGETFSFRVSTDSVTTSRPIEAFTLQYCTTAAGRCQAPGDNGGDFRDNSGNPPAAAYAGKNTYDEDGILTNNPGGRETNAQAHPAGRSDLDVSALTGAEESTDFTITITDEDDVTTDVTEDWTITTSNREDTAFVGALTGKHNFITLTHSGAGISPAFNDRIEIKFKASSDHYITNPGSGAFFVKMNTYESDTVQDETTIIDGGVTVANVMTDSIHITTKVLETMSFSVGTQNPDTQAVQHGSCDIMTPLQNNRLDLGNVNAENSLETGRAYDAFSYWRLSSNSSGGATVYYSGDTLKSTVGDAIAPMGNTGTKTAVYSQPGTEQFGLSLVDAGRDTFDSDAGRPFPENWVTPSLFPLNAEAHYNQGGYSGPTDPLYPISDETTANNGRFYFDANSRVTPELIAQNSDQVLSCATAKMRYVANIAADTPAGVYTTKINYLAAPQY